MNLLPLLLTVFIDSIGFGLVFPIFSPLIVSNEGGFFSPEVSLAWRGLMFGLLIGMYSLGQFFGGPLLGAASDRLGRKKILVFSTGISLLSYLLGALGIHFKNLFVLFFARLFAGLSAGNFAVAQSGVSDLSKKENKIKNFSLVGMSFWTGFVIGPFLGGKLAIYGYGFPFIIAGILCFLNLLLLLVLFEEKNLKVREGKILLFQGIFQIHQAFKLPALRGIFSVMFICCLGWGFFTEFSPIFLTRKLQFDVGQIANFYAWVGLWIALGQGMIIHPLLKWITPHNLMRLGLLSMALILPLLLVFKKILLLFCFVPFISLTQAMIFPAAATLVSELGSKEMQGEVMGMHNSIQWAAISIPPLFSGSFVALYPHLPITVGSGCMLIAFFIFLLFYSPKKAEE